MKIWIVVVKHRHSVLVEVRAVCDSEEKAKEIKGESNDVHIYEAEMNKELYPLA